MSRNEHPARAEAEGFLMNDEDRMPEHEHDYVYRGVVFKVGDQLPGSSAKRVTYYDAFFCRKCLHEDLKMLSRKATTYEPIAFGAVPARV